MAKKIQKTIYITPATIDTVEKVQDELSFSSFGQAIDYVAREYNRILTEHERATREVESRMRKLEEIKREYEQELQS